MAIPNNSLSNLEPGKFVTLEKVHPAGTLQVRKDAIGATYFYWRCTHLGRDFREPIGTFDTKCPPLSMEPTSAGYSRRAAAIKASELAILHKQHLSIGGFPGYLRQLEQARQKSERIAQEATEELRRSHEASLRETEARSKFNLSAMLMEYCDYLASLGRSAHSDARSIFALHITEAFPTTAAKPANEVTPEEIADMMRRLIELGKDRTANKLRSYVRAAYAVAKAARSKASIPLAFKAYRITVNPAAETSPDESANRPDKRPLSIDDLRTYWSLLQEVEGIKGVALRIHLLSGGQRIAQILRLIDSNITDEVALIFDGKGRPGKAPRPHPIPITAPVGMELDACKENRPFRLSTDNGKTHIATGTLSNWAVETVGDRIPGFLLKRVRSGVETALASAKVPKDYRSRLQSHGISGVQATHYDGYDYLEEKRKSMELLYRILTQPTGKVVQFSKRMTV